MKTNLPTLLLLIAFLNQAARTSGQSQCCVWSPRVNCDTLNRESDRQFCWLKLFSKNKLNIAEDIFEQYKDYRIGPNEVYLTGEKAPWGSDYFQWDKGGIARRWQVDSKLHLKDTLQLNWNAVEKMTAPEISLLSPAEKLDIYLGNKDFIITKTEMKRRGVYRKGATPNDGFCNGIRAAGALTPEPINNITMKSKDGIDVTFKPADLKALAGASYFHVWSDSAYAQIGCPNNVETECDPNPGVLDIALRLVLGKNQQTFFIDTSRNLMIYNKTIFGYNRKANAVASSITQDGVESKSIKVDITLYCLGDIPIEATNKPTKAIISDKNSLTTHSKWFRIYKFSYTLLVNHNGRITGSYWNSKNRPDFIWFAVGDGGDDRQPSSIKNANPYLSGTAIKELVTKSAH